MSEYVSKITLTVNGTGIEDFDEASEGEVEIYKRVELMNKTGHAAKTPRYGAKVKYVIPLGAEEFDFASVKDGTLSIQREGGKKITYKGVYPLKIGETKYGKDEASKEIEFGAEDRVEE